MLRNTHACHKPVSLVAVGTVAFDVIETPYDSAQDVLGGSATYAALTARLLSRQVGLIAVVGHDFPDDYVRLFERKGVDLAGLKIDPARLTFAWGGRYGEDPNQRTTLFTDLNVLTTFNPVVPPAFRESRIVLLGNLDPYVQLRVLDQMAHPEFTVCDTMNYWIANTPALLNDVLQRIDCLVINDEEARQLSGCQNLADAAEVIKSRGPRILVIKKGEHGAILFDETQVFLLPAFLTASVQDPTGAGDAFLGGFCGQLARESAITAGALRRAMLYGTVMASFAVERLGPDGVVHLSLDAVVQRMRAFKRAVAWPDLC